MSRLVFKVYLFFVQFSRLFFFFMCIFCAVSIVGHLSVYSACS